MMHYLVSFLLSIVLTSLSYFTGSRLIKNPITAAQSLIVGASVVSVGAATEALGAPVWLIVFMPFPVGMLLLYLFLKTSSSQWFLTYITILTLYSVIHVIMSYFFQFHSLIPAWTLS